MGAVGLLLRALLGVVVNGPNIGAQQKGGLWGRGGCQERWSGGVPGLPKMDGVIIPRIYTWDTFLDFWVF